MRNRKVIAAVLSNPEMPGLIEFSLRGKGLKVVTCAAQRNVDDILHFLNSTMAGVVIYEVGPPYKITVEMAKRLMNGNPDASWILTTSDAPLVEDIFGDYPHPPLFQKPHQIADLASVIVSLCAV